jgi:hypothetical protein
MRRRNQTADTAQSKRWRGIDDAGVELIRRDSEVLLQGRYGGRTAAIQISQRAIGRRER